MQITGDDEQDGKKERGGGCDSRMRLDNSHLAKVTVSCFALATQMGERQPFPILGTSSPATATAVATGAKAAAAAEEQKKTKFSIYTPPDPLIN